LISGKKKQKDINIDQIGYCSYFSSIKEKQKSFFWRDSSQ